jgi:hypothetical protein
MKQLGIISSLSFVLPALLAESRGKKDVGKRSINACLPNIYL